MRWAPLAVAWCHHTFKDSLKDSFKDSGGFSGNGQQWKWTTSIVWLPSQSEEEKEEEEEEKEEEKEEEEEKKEEELQNSVSADFARIDSQHCEIMATLRGGTRRGGGGHFYCAVEESNEGTRWEITQIGWLEIPGRILAGFFASPLQTIREPIGPKETRKKEEWHRVSVSSSPQKRLQMPKTIFKESLGRIPSWE